MRAERNYRTSNSPAWAMVMLMAVGLVIFGTYLAPDLMAPGRPEQTKGGAIGNQAPPAAVRRGAVITSIQAAPAADPVQESIDQYNAVQEAQAPAAPAAQPLPLNSAGEPVISQEQQAQQAQSLNMALDEGMTAVEAQQAQMREAANADALSRPPDVSYEDAKALLGRDPCHVPRANPATCAQGLFKPTPVN